VSPVADRKEMLIKFHENAKNKKANAPALEAPADVQLIGNDSETTVEATAVEVATSERRPKLPR
jgi:hypothetical protein